MFFRAIENILGLSRGKSWEDVRRELSDEQVKEIHTVYTALWPKDTQISDLLPRPDQRVFRALYVGLIDPRTIAASVVGWLRYFDEILVLNPFTNAAFMRSEYSPIDSPSQYKEQTIKNVALFMSLVSLVDAGVVHLIPDPIEFNDTFRQEVWAISKERRGKIKLSRDDLELSYTLGRDDLKRMLARLPDEDLRRQIQQSDPGLPDDKITKVMAYLRKEHAADPLALIQPLATGKDSGQLQVMRGVNFELALFLAQLTGAAIYSDQRLTRDDLEAARVWAPNDSAVADRMLPLRLVLAVNPEKIQAAREEPTSQAFRACLRALWAASPTQGETTSGPAIDSALSSLKDAADADLAAAQYSAEATSEPHDRLYEIDGHLLVPPHGYGLTAVRRFLVAFGRRRHTASVPLAILFGRAVVTATKAGAASSHKHR